MDSLSTNLTSFDDININCVIHDIPTIGVCADYFCKERKFLCMKCINTNETCITNNRHELVSLSELLYRFFIKQETKAIDLVEINSMMEALKEIDRLEITKNLSDFTKSCQNNVDKGIDDFATGLKERISTAKSENLTHLQGLNTKFKGTKNEDENIEKIMELDIPKILTQYNPSAVKEFLISEEVKTAEKENVIKYLKFFYNYEKIGKTIASIDEIIYFNKLSTEHIDKIGQDIDVKFSDLEEKIFKKIEELEKLLIPPKENIVIVKNASTKFNSNPNDLVFKMDICETAHKSNSIDTVFSVFRSLKGDCYVVWGTPSYSVEIYDLKLEKIVKTISAAHTSTIFSCRHYLDKKAKNDVVITSSYDRSVKVWSMKDNWANIVNIQSAHTGYYIYSVCVLSDELENKNYIISAAPNEYSKVWDFSGKHIRDFGVSNESTYFINSWYDAKHKKYYVINANSADVKVYDFKTGLLFKAYKGTPQTWHMSAIINEVANVTQLIESDGNGNVRIWDFYAGTMIKSIATSGINLRGICLWNDQYLFSAGSDYNVKLYDIKNATYIKPFNSHTSTVCALEKIVHPKYGECLISHALDGKLKIWTHKQPSLN